MNISITPELEKFIADEVKTGLYQSASEVVRAGLRRLKEDKERQHGFMVSSKEELEQEILEGIAQLNRGEAVTIQGDEALKTLFDNIKAKGRERLKKTRRPAE